MSPACSPRLLDCLPVLQSAFALSFLTHTWPDSFAHLAFISLAFVPVHLGSGIFIVTEDKFCISMPWLHLSANKGFIEWPRSYSLRWKGCKIDQRQHASHTGRTASAQQLGHTCLLPPQPQHHFGQHCWPCGSCTQSAYDLPEILSISFLLQLARLPFCWLQLQSLINSTKRSQVFSAQKRVTMWKYRYVK